MCADFRYLEKDIRKLEAAGVDMFHFDIMDGHFVPNFTLGPDIIRTVRQVSNLPFDIHLMLDNPDKYIEVFARAAAKKEGVLRAGSPNNFISVHIEACRGISHTLQLIKDCGARPAVALNPATPLSLLEPVLNEVDMVLVMTVNPGFAGQKMIISTIGKVKVLKEILESGAKVIDIEADGNVSNRNAPGLIKAGATVLVCGTSSIFKADLSLIQSLHTFRADLNLP
jgi:ribulose-phosphate 3-epimerase